MLKRLTGRYARGALKGETFYVNLAEAARILRMPAAVVSVWCDLKTIWGARKVGGVTGWLIPREEVIRFAVVLSEADRLFWRKAVETGAEVAKQNGDDNLLSWLARDLGPKKSRQDANDALGEALSGPGPFI